MSPNGFHRLILPFTHLSGCSGRFSTIEIDKAMDMPRRDHPVHGGLKENFFRKTSGSQILENGILCSEECEL
jgi:hypothetical protein